MNTKFAPRFIRSRPTAGFTLTEIAIVLGIAAVVIAGIWTAATSVNDRTHLSNALNQYSLISQNMTALIQGGYGATTSPCGAAAPPCDITAPMITAQTIPQSFIVAGNAVSPWIRGGFALRWMSASPPTYRMSFYNVSRSGCPGLIMAATACSPGKPGCPITVATGGALSPYTAPTAGHTLSITNTAPVTTAAAGTYCGYNDYAGGANSVEFDFTQ